MCLCVDVGMGSYANQESLWAPNGRMAGIDRCILDEVTGLWRMGVVTIESCCGHNQTEGYIAVAEGHEPVMVALGYTRDKTVDNPRIFAVKTTYARQAA